MVEGIALRHKVKTGAKAEAFVQVGNCSHLGLTLFGLYVVSEDERKPPSFWPKGMVAHGLLPCDDEELPHDFPLEASVPIFDRPTKAITGSCGGALNPPQKMDERARYKGFEDIVRTPCRTELPVIGTELPFAQDECQQLIHVVRPR